MADDNPMYSDEQVMEFRRQFSNFDFKHLGAVRREDLGNLLRACGQAPTEGWIKERMKVADPEGRGVIEWDGFMKLLNQAVVQGNPDDELLEAFRRFDKGLTGNIRSSDLRQLMTTLGDILDEEEVDELIREGDPMSEGIVNYEALVRTLIYGPN